MTDIKDHRKRLEHIDIVKGWSILVILIFHSTSGLFSPLASGFLGQSWPVAVFFVISGFFMKTEALSEPKVFLLRKFRTLYVPATIIYFIAVLLHNHFVRLGWYPLGEIYPGNGLPYSFYSAKEIFVKCLKVIFCMGSGELVMGAMWFLYTLLYSFVGIAFLWIVMRKCEVLFQKNTKSHDGFAFCAMSVFLFGLATASCICTQKYGIKIPRLSTAFSAMFLIWTGMIINQKFKWTFDNNWMLVICIIIFTQYVLLQKVTLKLANNRYQDMMQLSVGTCSLIYIWGYIAKRITKTFAGRVLSKLGRESFYLMALHIFGFFLCNSLLKNLGVFSELSPHGLYTYNMNGNFWVFILYLLFGILVPMLIISCFRSIKTFISRRWAN